MFLCQLGSTDDLGKLIVLARAGVCKLRGMGPYNGPLPTLTIFRSSNARLEPPTPLRLFSSTSTLPLTARYWVEMDLLNLVMKADIGSALLAAATAYTLYLVGTVIYRLRFSPIAGFPGPKIAAATGWYEFYYDACLNGKYIFEIEKMHKKYG